MSIANGSHASNQNPIVGRVGSDRARKLFQWPQALIRSVAYHSLSSNARLIAFILHQHADNESWDCTVLQGTLGKLVGIDVSDRTVQRAIRELRDAGIIDIRRRRNRSSVYTLLPSESFASTPRNDTSVGFKRPEKRHERRVSGSRSDTSVVTVTTPMSGPDPTPVSHITTSPELPLRTDKGARLADADFAAVGSSAMTSSMATACTRWGVPASCVAELLPAYAKLTSHWPKGVMNNSRESSTPSSFVRAIGMAVSDRWEDDPETAAWKIAKRAEDHARACLRAKGKGWMNQARVPGAGSWLDSALWKMSAAAMVERITPFEELDELQAKVARDELARRLDGETDG